MISTATGPGSLYLTGEEELTYEWYREAVYSRRRGTVGQCTRDSNRAIARQCETAGVSPRSEPLRTIPKHRTDEERRGRPATYRNIPGTPARNTRHITRSSSTDRSICGRRIPPGKRRVATMHRKQSRFPWSPGGAARRDHLQAAAKAKKNLVTSTGGATPRPLQNSAKPAPGRPSRRNGRRGPHIEA